MKSPSIKINNHEPIDLNLQAIYIASLPRRNWMKKLMDNCNFITLELQLETLIKSRQELKDENSCLRHKLVKLTQERAELIDKNSRAMAKIKRILAQLRNEVQ
jgi:uncharacterized protein (TIGR02449 family)